MGTCASELVRARWHARGEGDGGAEKVGEPDQTDELKSLRVVLDILRHTASVIRPKLDIREKRKDDNDW